jgi:hypothetical protein
MDANRFDAMARTLDISRNRRGMLGAMLAAIGLTVPDGDGAVAEKRRGKGKRNRRRGKGQCADCSGRSVAEGADLRGCDLDGRDLSGADLRSAELDGACLRSANLAGARLSSADFEGADVRGANFTDADLDRADIRNWRADGAVFCRTTMPDGSLNSADCPPGSGDGTCLVLSELCSEFGGSPCCDYGTRGNTFCGGTVIPLVTTCQAHCRNDTECHRKMGTTDVQCANDFLSDANCGGREFDPNLHCCARKYCEQDGDCQNGLCCQLTNKTKQCCLAGERCLPAPLGCGR